MVLSSVKAILAKHLPGASVISLIASGAHLVLSDISTVLVMRILSCSNVTIHQAISNASFYALGPATGRIAIGRFGRHISWLTTIATQDSSNAGSARPRPWLIRQVVNKFLSNGVAAPTKSLAVVEIKPQVRTSMPANDVMGNHMLVGVARLASVVSAFKNRIAPSFVLRAITVAWSQFRKSAFPHRVTRAKSGGLLPILVASAHPFTDIRRLKPTVELARCYSFGNMFWRLFRHNEAPSWVGVLDEGTPTYPSRGHEKSPGRYRSLIPTIIAQTLVEV